MSQFFDVALKQLKYALSLPERTIRSLTALAGGTTSLLTETLFPEVLRGTTLYKIFLGDTQQFMLEKIAQIKKEKKETDPVETTDDDYVQRKMVGGALETAGLFAMHFSPLWVFAIAADAAAGSRVFLDRLVNQLKTNGVVPEDAQANDLADLLTTIQETSCRSASAIDRPPLSRDQINQLADEMTQSYGQIFSQATNLVPRLETIWTQMEQLADRENVSLERISGLLTVDVASWAKKGIGAVLAVGQTGSAIMGEEILDSYARTLDTVAEEGVTAYLKTKMTPFLQAATAHFAPDKKTWTESTAESLAGLLVGRTQTDGADKITTAKAPVADGNPEMPTTAPTETDDASVELHHNMTPPSNQEDVPPTPPTAPPPT